MPSNFPAHAAVRFVSAFLLICVHPLACLATDILVFSNHDRLAGSLVKEEDGIIQFVSDSLGTITVDSSRAHIEQTDPSLATPVFVPGQGGFSVIDIRTAATNPATALDAQPSIWTRKVEFGLSAQSGQLSSSDVNIRLEADRRGESSEMRMLVSYLYGETGNTRTTDSLDSSVRVRRNLSDVLFAQGVSHFDRDTIKRIENNAEQSFGLGRNVVNTDGVVLAMGAGAAARYRNQDGNPISWDYLVDAFQDFRIALNNRLSLSQDLSVVVAPARSDDYKVKVAAGLVSRLSQALNMSMRYEFEHDSALDPDTRSNQRLVTSIGYTF